MVVVVVMVMLAMTVIIIRYNLYLFCRCPVVVSFCSRLQTVSPSHCQPRDEGASSADWCL